METILIGEPPSVPMPSISSLLLENDEDTHHQPCYTFHGPDTKGQIRALNSSQVEVARFLLGQYTVTRIFANPQQVCVLKRSSLSGTITLGLHGLQVEQRQSWEGAQYGKDIMSVETLRWRSGSNGYEELRDGRKFLFARGKLATSFSRRSSALEVFVPGDEFLLDLVVASWFSMVKGQNAEEQER